MVRWVFVVLAFAAMMVYGSVIYAEEAEMSAPAPETATEVAAPTAAPAGGTEAAPAGDTTTSVPADTGTTEDAPVKGGSSCGGK